MQGSQTQTKTFLAHNKIGFIIIYSDSAIDLYTMRAYSLEHKQCYNFVTAGTEKNLTFYKSAGTFYHMLYKIVVS